MAINFFNSLEYLEPRCQGCSIVLEYGLNTRYDERSDANFCENCGAEIK